MLFSSITAASLAENNAQSREFIVEPVPGRKAEGESNRIESNQSNQSNQSSKKIQSANIVVTLPVPACSRAPVRLFCV